MYRLAAIILIALQVSRAEIAENLASASAMRSIPLQKQYVPVMKDGQTIAYKTAYFGEIKVGSPAQTFTVVFDTGSGHVLLPRTSCTSVACGKHRRYDLVASQSGLDIKPDGSPISANNNDRDQVVISFGTGKVTGEFAQDVVCTGGSTESCTNMRFVLATEMTEDPFAHFAFDGVMGLGLDSLRLDPTFSFFGQMANQYPEMLPQFSVYLSRHDDGQSKITFGGHDEQLASSDIAWAPIALPELGYWLLNIKQIRIGDTILDDCADGGCRAIADTGTSLLGVPREMSRTLHRLLARPVPSDGKHPKDVDCRQVPGHSIDFDLGDTVVSLPVEDYSRPAPINMSTNTSNGSSLICRSLLLPVDMKAPVGPKIFIWGEPVLRRYMTVYDFKEKRIGFSLARQPQLPSSESQGEVSPGSGSGSSSGSIGMPPQGSLLAGAPLPGAARATETLTV